MEACQGTDLLPRATLRTLLYRTGAGAGTGAAAGARPGQAQTAEQKEANSYKQRLATLSREWETVARKESDAIERVAEEASAKDRTGWFKRTQWDKHLQAYPDWRLLSYAIRLPAANEPALQHVVQLVEQLVEEAVQGLSTLSLKTLR